MINYSDPICEIIKTLSNFQPTSNIVIAYDKLDSNINKDRFIVTSPDGSISSVCATYYNKKHGFYYSIMTLNSLHKFDDIPIKLLEGLSVMYAIQEKSFDEISDAFVLFDEKEELYNLIKYPNALTQDDLTKKSNEILNFIEMEKINNRINYKKEEVK